LEHENHEIARKARKFLGLKIFAPFVVFRAIRVPNTHNAMLNLSKKIRLKLGKTL